MSITRRFMVSGSDFNNVKATFEARPHLSASAFATSSCNYGELVWLDITYEDSTYATGNDYATIAKWAHYSASYCNDIGFL